MADLLSTILGLAAGRRERVEVEEIDVEDILISPHQPREVFDPEALEELARSLGEIGVIQPIVVRRKGAKYELVAGERRLRAAKIARLRTIPAIVRQLDDDQSLAVALVENLQREDLNPMEEAKVYLRLVKDLKLSQREVAEKLGKSPKFISQMIRLTHLPEEIQHDVSRETLSKGHAFALLQLKEARSQIVMAQKIKERHLSVEQTENAIRRLLKGKRLEKEEVEQEVGSLEQLDVARDIYGKLRNVLGHYRLGRKNGVKMRRTIRKDYVEIRVIIPR